MMSRHQLRLACGGLDIICASCYEVVNGGTKFPIALKMPMAVFWKNQNWGLTGIKKWLIIDNKKWVFTVHLATACSFLFLLPEYHTDIFCHFQHG